MPLQFMIFSWNADGLALCKVSTKKSTSKRCVEVNFVDNLRTQVLQGLPDVLVFNTQGMSRHDSHFHGQGGVAEAIVLGSGYRLLTSTYVDEVGFTRSLSKGTVGKSLSLQTSVYVKSTLEVEVTKKGVFSNFFSSEPYYLKSSSDPVQGCLACVLTIPRYGKCLLLNVNLTEPPRKASPFEEINRECHNRLAMNEIMERFYLLEERPRYVITSGDYNIPGGDIKGIRNLFQGPILGDFLEGVDNAGAKFEPTEILIPHVRTLECQTRPTEKCFVTKKYSYGQRCLYHSIDNVSPLTCNRYQRIDYGSMSEGTTAGIITVITAP